MKKPLRKAATFIGALALVVLLWEGYKVVGPANGGRLFGARVLPRSDDNSMPHLWDMLRRFGRPEVRGANPRTVGAAVAAGAWYTGRLAVGGFVIGGAVGLVLAMLMTRFRIARTALLPYIVLSQTVPLIALSPLIVGWGGQLKVFGHDWQPWMSVSLISSYLAFFPVSIGALRGLQSPEASSVELMDSYAASWRETLVKLRFPAAVPFIVPSLRLAAAASVVGAVVAEISTGLRGGIGRLVLEYSREATGDPAKVYTAVIAAAVLGLLMAGVVTAVDMFLMRNRPKADAT